MEIWHVAEKQKLMQLHKGPEFINRGKFVETDLPGGHSTRLWSRQHCVQWHQDWLRGLDQQIGWTRQTCRPSDPAKQKQNPQQRAKFRFVFHTFSRFISFCVKEKKLMLLGTPYHLAAFIIIVTLHLFYSTTPPMCSWHFTNGEKKHAESSKEKMHGKSQKTWKWLTHLY